MDNFKDAPPSITELRAHKNGDGSLWTPRDALINLLRDIDNGLNVDILIVAYRANLNENEIEYNYRNATPNPLTAIGLLGRIDAILKR